MASSSASFHIFRFSAPVICFRLSVNVHFPKVLIRPSRYEPVRPTRPIGKAILHPARNVWALIEPGPAPIEAALNQFRTCNCYRHVSDQPHANSENIRFRTSGTTKAASVAYALRRAHLRHCYRTKQFQMDSSNPPVVASLAINKFRHRIGRPLEALAMGELDC